MPGVRALGIKIQKIVNTIMPNPGAAPLSEQKSFRVENSGGRVKTRLLSGLLYYPLTNEELSELRRKLIPSEIFVLMHLRTLFPFGDRPIEITVRGLARDMELDPATVSRALKRLAKDKHIHLEILQSSMRVQPKGLLMSRLHPELLGQQELELDEEYLL